MEERMLLSADILYGKIRSGNVRNVSWTIFLPWRLF
ncbi:MAG TPA: LEPR-XLL domain-containing protein [Candidatus Mediterraneibacter excrementigallinarum]|nr:LEPR-XLL domain-containing protein [Candidatus Mediterraneibacter excrementigallinarum]